MVVMATALMVALATLMVTFATFVMMFAIAAGLLTGLYLAAVFSAFIDTGLAMVLGAGGVLASALVVAVVVMLAHLSLLGEGVHGGLAGIVVTTGGHAECKSGSHKSS